MYQRNAVIIGLTGGIQYDIPLFIINEIEKINVTLTPSFLYKINFTKYSQSGMSSWTFCAGLALKVGL